MKSLKSIVTYILVAFVLISVGFIFGKHAGKSVNANSSVESGNYVAVYYLHSSFRCVTCNNIEKMTQELLDKNYAQELEIGSIRWQEVDFQEDTALAEKFKVVASTVVVAQVEAGHIVDFKRLDDVWTKNSDVAAFNSYVAAAIDGYVNPEKTKL